MGQLTDRLNNVLRKSPIIPVIAIQDENDAIDIAESFLNAGILNIEVVLRTPSAISSIQNISSQFSSMIIGAGTVLTKQQAQKAINAGVSYIVSPGFSEAVSQICLEASIPYMPGAVTPTEIQKASDKGYSFLKFFPSEAMGGVQTLKSYAPVFENIQFCATGGINAENISSYLALPNVISVGTSALLTNEIQMNKDWGRIAELVALIEK